MESEELRAKRLARERAYRQSEKHRNNYLTNKKRYALKSKYGLSLNDFAKMRMLQQDLCYLCHEEKMLCVDHNHITGKVRKLLCSKCNGALGILETLSLSMREKMLKYLELHND